MARKITCQTDVARRIKLPLPNKIQFSLVQKKDITLSIALF